MKFDIITILPNFFDSFLKESLIKKALEKKLIDIRVHNLRKWALGKHQVVDDSPYGGGPGMILKFEPFYKAVKSLRSKVQGSRSKIIFLSPRGKMFNQTMAKKWAKFDQLIFISGRYESVDERVAEISDEVISVGDYITLGGDVPTMSIIECVARLVPGTVGRRDSIEKLDFPQYTRPEVVNVKSLKAKVKSQKLRIKNLRVPKVLLSGNHKLIDEWREKNAKEIR
ncbi:MAG: tRNA (guanosine(37)-N1)-methyltransferase TrmD [Parcubacteria group bacterium]|nr:tRNA (guanosine(37)-N1)-methyltransferase TrmD [Parcubacteria group bacterium]